MACHTNSWTFSTLVGAFLDLALAYLLLCGSTLAFFVSNFLSFFGFNLPCPCNGLFGDPNCTICLQKLLVDSPTSKISSVQTSVKNKFPFDSIWMKDDKGRRLNVRLLRENDQRCCDGFLEMEGEASCSSFSDARASKKTDLVGFRSSSSPSVRRGLSDVKGKGIFYQRPRSGALRRRRRAVFDSSRMIGFDASNSPFGGSLTRQEITEEEEDSSVPLNSVGDEVQHDEDAPTGTDLCGGTQGSFQFNEFLVESENVEKDMFSSPELISYNKQESGFGQSETHTIRVLEQALEEEHSARAALYMELEKERSAAASAADEAMAMILRLQKEKASIEMEARQYQRMIEEKSAYDLEEMDILKEILLRREREKHVLEKEVEAYRQIMMIHENEQFEGDLNGMVGMSKQRPNSSFDSSEDTGLMLHQINGSISKKEMVKDNIALSYIYQKNNIALSSDNIALSGEKPNCGLPHGPKCMNEFKEEFQEKGMVSVDKQPSASQGQEMRLEVDSVFCKLNGFQEHKLLEKTIIFVDEEPGEKDNARVCQEMAVENGPTHSEMEISFPCDGVELEKHGKDADQGGRDHRDFVFEAESSVHDVHVIDNKCILWKQEIDTSLDRFRQCDRPNTSRAEAERDIHRGSSDVSSGLDKSQGKGLLFDLRRNSISTVDNERLKLETEVGWLRERLRVVQEGRDRLSFSVEHRERENIQLQILEDIASQLREIRQLTEPGKAVRQASLPPPTSKVSSKKRRCRSVSWGFHGSS